MRIIDYGKVFFKDSRVKYLTVGGVSALLEYGSFWLFVSIIGIYLLAGNVLSFLIGFLFSFIMHNRWSFAGNHTHGVKVQFVSYGVLAAINVVATTFLIGVQVDVLEFPPMVAKFICMALVVVWNYLLLNKVIFKRQG